MLNPDSVGSTFAGTDSVTLSQSEIDSFCAVIGESDTSIAPPTFTIRITLNQFEEILTRPEIGLDWSRLVHGDQKFEIFSPVKAGDQLTCSATIESYRVAAGNEIVSVRSDLQREGQLVISAWSTLVVRA
jgi:N-terminal half of MaoC dehydratase